MVSKLILTGLIVFVSALMLARFMLSLLKSDGGNC